MSLLSEALDGIQDSVNDKSYPEGDEFEMLAPIAVQYCDQMDVTFSKADYKFTISGCRGGMVWTKDISYGTKLSPPPPHPTLGVPLPKQVLKYIRPATDE